MEKSSVSEPTWLRFRLQLGSLHICRLSGEPETRCSDLDFMRRTRLHFNYCWNPSCCYLPDKPAHLWPDVLHDEELLQSDAPLLYSEMNRGGNWIRLSSQTLLYKPEDNRTQRNSSWTSADLNTSILPQPNPLWRILAGERRTAERCRRLMEQPTQ